MEELQKYPEELRAAELRAAEMPQRHFAAELMAHEERFRRALAEDADVLEAFPAVRTYSSGAQLTRRYSCCAALDSCAV